jgi:uncharacterized coiled-coil protein SlyX
MTDPLENETTQQLPQSSLEERVAKLEAGQITLQVTLNEMNAKLDVLIQLQREMIKMQQDMYVDLRGPIVALSGEVFQIQKDIQPDSFQNRLMRMGQ